MNDILGGNHIVPVLWIYDGVTEYRSILISILKLGRYFQDHHSEGIVLHHEIDPVSGIPLANLPAKICFWGISTSYVKEMPHLDVNDKAGLTFEANVLFFGRLFYCVWSSLTSYPRFATLIIESYILMLSNHLMTVSCMMEKWT
ncbi:hypothetical protein M378DRAFT_814962 [Amanita muscaria Koide BX008]|uniref:Uncharacterized protein n=1 Tax=Amanita muscaria (strain Koide BX008) TaxID=946122 RepID=A0A0C2VZT1_AMAMK|nr:hypothetical protein M378DRAFT_814962 [Amanita muscaria Koide BX008]